MHIDIRTTLNHRFVRYGLTLVAGLILGWLLFGRSPREEKEAEHAHAHSEQQIWSCSMHPQIRMEKPGKCPLCAMDLIPLQTSGSDHEALHPDAIQLSKEAVALANIQTTKVSRENPVKTIRLYGSIQVDERLSQSQASHVSGRIEKLSVNFTGESVRQGQTIATVYSPELLNAQQELLEALKLQPEQPLLLQAAREKLRLRKLSDEQITAIERAGVAAPLVEIKANTSGIITEKIVNQGDYVSAGSILFNIADLTRVWAVFEAYEPDLPFLKTGDRLEYTLPSLPGKTFSGKITFISPVLDPVTRTAGVRVETANPRMELMPGMYADAVAHALLSQHKDAIVIPASAVLWTGKRSVVYVLQPGTENPAFRFREVELGASLGDSYVVLSGISDGEEIVTAGTFVVDASAQLQGKRSMMNEEDEQSAAAHNRHAMMTVQGLCGMCKERIEKTAGSVKGVSSATWDSDTKQLHLDFDPAQTGMDEISRTVAVAGHDTDRHKAPQDVYDALPACCKYREN
jgi:Cu(I)/Ag(I) efflux system membrane fusion protein